MGKTAKSITALSSKTKKQVKELQKASLQKPQKKVIQKDSARAQEAAKAKRKQDLIELKQLLKLEANTPVNPNLLNANDDGEGLMNAAAGVS